MRTSFTHELFHVPLLCGACWCSHPRIKWSAGMGYGLDKPAEPRLVRVPDRECCRGAFLHCLSSALKRLFRSLSQLRSSRARFTLQRPTAIAAIRISGTLPGCPVRLLGYRSEVSALPYFGRKGRTVAPAAAAPGIGGPKRGLDGTPAGRLFGGSIQIFSCKNRWTRP